MFDYLLSFASDYWQDVNQLFSNSQQRLFWGYWCCALVVAIGWILKTNKISTQAHQPSFGIKTKQIVSRLNLKHFITPSAKADYKLIVINKALFLFVSPYLITKLAIATALFESFHLLSTPLAPYTANIPTGLIIGVFTVWVFIIDDLARFYCHKLMHDIPWLWQFHKTHHSATSLTPLTVLRTHPVEGIIFAIRSALVQGFSLAVFFFCFGDRLDLYTVLNLNILVFLFNIAGANLRHSHISIGYWKWLEKLIISPAQHQIHHSTKVSHFNKNYGAMLAIWDHWAGTLHLSNKNQKLSFGLTEAQASSEHQLSSLYFSPFINIYRSLKKVAKNAVLSR